MKNHQSVLAVAHIVIAALLLAVHPTFGQAAEDASHPSDPYFALDRVLAVTIEMAPEDWVVVYFEIVFTARL